MAFKMRLRNGGSPTATAEFGLSRLKSAFFAMSLAASEAIADALPPALYNFRHIFSPILGFADVEVPPISIPPNEASGFRRPVPPRTGD